MVEERRDELEILRETCRVIVDFIKQRNKKQQIYYEDVIDSFYLRNYAKGLLGCIKEFIFQMKEEQFEENDFIQLKKILKEHHLLSINKIQQQIERKQLNPVKEQELQVLKQTCDVIIQFIEKHTRENDNLMNKQVEIFYKRNNIKGLKAVINELVLFMQEAEFSLSLLFQLNSDLKAKGLPEIIKIIEKQENLIGKIIKRGYIKTDEEGEAVNNYITIRYADPSRAFKIEALEKLPVRIKH